MGAHRCQLDRRRRAKAGARASDDHVFSAHSAHRIAAPSGKASGNVLPEHRRESDKTIRILSILVMFR
jgi:hypothetical protein